MRAGLSRFCSNQETSKLPAPEHRRFRRVHGLQLPLHPQQLLGWLVFVIVAAGTFGVLIPPLSPQLKAPILSLVLCVFFIHIGSHLSASLLDPAEPAVRARPRDVPLPEFDRAIHRHVIEAGRCHLCNVDASSKRTKHCSICNKCIEGFDHHCKWLNNCIGVRNYPAFVACLLSAVVSTVSVIGISATELSVVVFAAKGGTYGSSSGGRMEDVNVTLPLSFPLPATSSLVVISLVGILSAIAAVLLIHLCFFHGYIACLGLTTYEYVRSRQNKGAAVAPTLPATSTAVPPPSTAASKKGFKFPGSKDPATRYRFCEDVDSITAAEEVALDNSKSVYLCSSHSARDTCSTISRRPETEKERRNFRLYFTYNSHHNETSLELTTDNTPDNNSNERDDIYNRPRCTREISNTNRPQIELKPLTPSPVSCCFSILGQSHFDKQANKQQQRRRELENGKHAVVPQSSCTLKRIRMFLRSRLRKASDRPRRQAGEIGYKRNRVTPAASPDSTNRDDLTRRSINVEPRPGLEIISTESSTRLAPLNLPTTPPPIMMKRSQNQPLRVRRNSMHKRPRFKVGPHLAQSAQLSPIPESELSKPASPRSPPLSRFAFPPPKSA